MYGPCAASASVTLAGMSRPHAAFAVAAPGLAPLVAEELRAIGLRPTAADDAGVAFAAHDTGVWAANLRLRTASRVLVRLGEFRAEDFRTLEREARGLPWETLLEAGAAPALRVTCRKSRLYHSDAVAGRVADAIAHRIGGRGAWAVAAAEEQDGEGEERDEGGEADGAPLVVVRFLHDVCTVSVDASGGLLHRRGYRQAVGRAPLRETLAAAMLLAAGYDGSAPLLDPLCGAGTIPIEGAMIARGLAPGRHRRFAFERWPRFDAARWAAMLAEADERALPRAPHPIVGSDRDEGAVAMAAENAERAGVAADVRFERRAVSALEPLPERGWVVSNPPYGKRVGESGPLRDLWARLGDVLRVRAPGWRAALLGPDPSLERQLRLPLTPSLRTTNGGIPVRVLVGTVPTDG